MGYMPSDMAVNIINNHSLYKRLLDLDKEKKVDSWLDVAANHGYICKCPSCFLFFVHTCGPVEYEDEEFGPFNRILIDAGRAYLGLPAVIKTSCITCGSPIWDFVNNTHYCEDHYIDTVVQKSEE